MRKGTEIKRGAGQREGESIEHIDLADGHNVCL